MRDNASQLIFIIEDDSIGPRATTIINISGLQNGKLIVRFGHGELEALVVAVRVRVVASLIAGRFETVPLFLGRIHSVLRVADTAAGVGTGSFLCL